MTIPRRWDSDSSSQGDAYGYRFELKNTTEGKALDLDTVSATVGRDGLSDPPGNITAELFLLDGPEANPGYYDRPRAIQTWPMTGSGRRTLTFTLNSDFLLHPHFGLSWGVVMSVDSKQRSATSDSIAPTLTSGAASELESFSVLAKTTLDR